MTCSCNVKTGEICSNCAKGTWQTIDNAPCDDTLAMVRWSDGSETIQDLDHDSDPQWWSERGAVEWRPLTEEEADKYHQAPR